MSKVKVYKKRGRTNYKEKKMVDAIQPILDKKLADDPNFKFDPVTNLEDLKSLHDSLISESVPFEEVADDEQPSKTTKSEQESSDNPDDMTNTEEIEEIEEIEEQATADRDFVDPFNRENPNVRDYVLEGTDYAEDKLKEVDQNQTFDEPLSEEAAFRLEEDEPDEKDAKSDSSSDSGSDSGKEKTKSSSDKKTEPVNPSFSGMDNKKQKRSTKRFAKYIVEAVVTLTEKGFVWFANKDINEAKLAEYELSGEIDLTLIVTLEGGQEATIKEFFQNQCAQAEHLSKIDEEQKKDLTDALAEVLMEKGAAPTPTQELMMVGFSILGGQAMNLIALKSQTNSLLKQLRARNEGEEYEEHQYEQEHQEQTQSNSDAESQEVEQVDEEIVEIEEAIDENKLIDKPVKTKE